jgi:hypothetical protein
VARILIGATTVNRAWATHHGSQDQTPGEEAAVAQQPSPLAASRLVRRGWRAARQRHDHLHQVSTDTDRIPRHGQGPEP